MVTTRASGGGRKEKGRGGRWREGEMERVNSQANLTTTSSQETIHFSLLDIPGADLNNRASISSFSGIFYRISWTYSNIFLLQKILSSPPMSSTHREISTHPNLKINSTLFLFYRRRCFSIQLYP